MIDASASAFAPALSLHHRPCARTSHSQHSRTHTSHRCSVCAKLSQTTALSARTPAQADCQLPVTHASSSDTSMLLSTAAASRALAMPQPPQDNPLPNHQPRHQHNHHHHNMLPAHGRVRKSCNAGMRTARTTTGRAHVEMVRPGQCSSSVVRRRSRPTSPVSPLAVARVLFADSDSDADLGGNAAGESSQGSATPVAGSTTAVNTPVVVPVRSSVPEQSRGDDVAELLRDVLRKRHAAFLEAWGFDVLTGRPSSSRKQESAGSLWVWEPLEGPEEHFPESKLRA